MLLVCGACGSADPPIVDRLTACELVTPRQVAAAIGRAVRTPADSADAPTDQLAGRSGCAWSSDDGEVGVLVELVRTGDMARSVRRTGFSAAARFRAADADHPGAERPPAGDAARYAPEESKLWVLEGDDLVIIEVAVSPTAAARDMAVELGVEAASRLQRAD
jgi:hypothetical protein